MARPTKLLGYDGLPTDETVTSFRLDEKGQIIKWLWGIGNVVTPHEAIAGLGITRRVTARFLKTDPLAGDRIRNIDKTIAAIEQLL